MHDLGFKDVERVAVPVARNRHNGAYLDAKERRMGHVFVGTAGDRMPNKCRGNSQDN
jgi:hypothetical protein